MGAFAERDGSRSIAGAPSVIAPHECYDDLVAASLRRAWIRLGAWCLAGSGLLFVAFPAIRPFTDSSPDPLIDAQTFASTPWLLAHLLGMVAFVLLALGLLGLCRLLEERPAGRLAFWSVVTAWIGVGLALPYFGIEAFSLNVIGERAVSTRSPELIALAESIRMGLGVAFFGLGLLLIGIAAILFALAAWTSGILPRWSGVPLAVGLALYIPQFLFPQAIRVAHGLWLAVGCIWLAASALKRSDTNARTR